jgi:nitroimidazol reductase NimA-like FMN-containing flavoprotein (pyridoxamine 5'-phosphate oxidase superfamily)
MVAADAILGGSMSDSTSDPTRLRRHPERGSHDRAVIDAIVDEALVCHLAVVRDGRPVVLPMLHTRLGDYLYVHGAAANALLGAGREAEVCLCVSLLDGLVLARSAFHHSLNYRSVVVFGRAEAVTDEEEKRRALEALVEHVARGRSADCRAPSENELKATLVLRIPLSAASAKVRAGPVVDAPEDLSLPHWAGILPLRLVAGDPEPDANLPAEASTPAYVRDYRRPTVS